MIVYEIISTVVDLESQTRIDDRLGVEIRPSNVQLNRVLPSSESNERHTRYTSSVADWQGSHHTVETQRQAEWNSSINVTEAQRNRYEFSAFVNWSPKDR